MRGAKLNEEDVKEIFLSPLAGVDLARRFGVNKSRISEIRSGKRWTRITSLLKISDEVIRERQRRSFECKPRGERHFLARLTEQQVREIFLSPKTVRGIARELGVSGRLVYNIRNKESWTHITNDLLISETVLEERRKEAYHASAISYINNKIKLTIDQVVEIKKKLDKGGYGIIRGLARDYGVSPTLIIYIRDKKRWARATLDEE
jgi:transcriptional regulator with XRE-family HTH domain